MGVWDCGTKNTRLYKACVYTEKYRHKNDVGFFNFYVPRSHGIPQTLAAVRLEPWDMLSHGVPQSHERRCECGT